MVYLVIQLTFTLADFCSSFAFWVEFNTMFSPQVLWYRASLLRLLQEWNSRLKLLSVFANDFYSNISSCFQFPRLDREWGLRKLVPLLPGFFWISSQGDLVNPDPVSSLICQGCTYEGCGHLILSTCSPYPRCSLVSCIAEGGRPERIGTLFLFYFRTYQVQWLSLSILLLKRF